MEEKISHAMIDIFFQLEKKISQILTIVTGQSRPRKIRRQVPPARRAKTIRKTSLFPCCLRRKEARSGENIFHREEKISRKLHLIVALYL
jgi:hypothetical protein